MAQGEGELHVQPLCWPWELVQQLTRSLTLYRGAGVEISPSPKRWEGEAAAKEVGPGLAARPSPKTLTLGCALGAWALGRIWGRRTPFSWALL